MKSNMLEILKALKKSGTEDRAHEPFELGVQLPCPDWESLVTLEGLIKNDHEYSRLVSKLELNSILDLYIHQMYV